MAIACLRLRTRAPDPLLRVPDLRRRIAEATVFDVAVFLFAMSVLRGLAIDVMTVQSTFRAKLCRLNPWWNIPCMQVIGSLRRPVAAEEYRDG